MPTFGLYFSSGVLYKTTIQLKKQAKKSDFLFQEELRRRGSLLALDQDMAIVLYRVMNRLGILLDHI